MQCVDAAQCIHITSHIMTGPQIFLLVEEIRGEPHKAVRPLGIALQPYGARHLLFGLCKTLGCDSTGTAVRKKTPRLLV